MINSGFVCGFVVFPDLSFSRNSGVFNWSVILSFFTSALLSIPIGWHMFKQAYVSSQTSLLSRLCSWILISLSIQSF